MIGKTTTAFLWKLFYQIRNLIDSVLKDDAAKNAPSTTFTDLPSCCGGTIAVAHYRVQG